MNRMCMFSCHSAIGTKFQFFLRTAKVALAQASADAPFVLACFGRRPRLALQQANG